MTNVTKEYDLLRQLEQRDQRLEDIEKKFEQIEKLAFKAVGTKTHEDADLALVQIHAIAKEAVE